MDLEELGDRLEVGVVRAVGERQLEVEVLALGTVEPVLFVRVAPVLERVADDVARALVEPEAELQEAVEAVGPCGVEVDPRLLVGDPVRVLAALEVHFVPGQLREREAVGRVEREAPVLVEAHDGGPRGGGGAGPGDDLARRLRHRRLGEVTAEDPVLVRADGGRFEPHRVGELGADDADDRHHEEDDDQREAALGRHWVPTCRETVSGGSVWA